VARVAGQAAGVVGGDDLGEGFGLGAVGFVAAGAEDGCVELGRRHRGRVVGVTRLGSVAGFAGDDDVPALFFLIDYVGVAGFAGVVSGKGDWPGGDLGDGGATVVAVLAKAARDDGGPQDDECYQRDQHHGCEPDEMFDVLEQVVFLSAEKTQCSWITGIGPGNDD